MTDFQISTFSVLIYIVSDSLSITTNLVFLTHLPYLIVTVTAETLFTLPYWTIVQSPV